MDVWLNRYGTTNDFNSWTYRGDFGPAADQPRCPQRGNELHDLGVRFADITGNGKVDMLCLEKDGRTFRYLKLEDFSQLRLADYEV